MQRIAVGRYWSRGKVQLVLMRPYQKGLILHQVYYANEVRAYDDIELGADHNFSAAEQQLAERLIEQLSCEAFAPDKYHDEYAERVRKAADEKAAGQQITVAPEQPVAQIIDLFEALKQSLQKAQDAAPQPQVEAPAAQAAPKPEAKLKGPSKAAERPKRAGKRQLG
jgi:DNA end-binding protein Ku